MEENSCAMEVLRRRRSTSVVRERAASEGNDNVDAAAVMQEPGSGALEVRGEAGPSGAQGPNPFWSPRAQQAFADHQRRLQGVSADPGHIPALALGDADSNQQRLVAPAGQPVVFGPTAVSSRIEVGLDGSLQNQRELNDRELGENASPGSEASFLSRLEKGVEPGISPAESQEPELIPGGLDEGPARTPAELRHLIKGLWEESQRLNARVQYLESKTSSQRTSTNSAASVRDLPASPETAEQHDGDAKSQESQGVQGRGRDSVATGGLSRGVANSRDRDLRASPVQPLFPEGGAPTTSALLDVKLPVGEGRSAVAYPGQAAREWVDRRVDDVRAVLGFPSMQEPSNVGAAVLPIPDKGFGKGGGASQGAPTEGRGPARLKVGHQWFEVVRNRDGDFELGALLDSSSGGTLVGVGFTGVDARATSRWPQDRSPSPLGRRELTPPPKPPSTTPPPTPPPLPALSSVPQAPFEWQRVCIPQPPPAPPVDAGWGGQEVGGGNGGESRSHRDPFSPGDKVMWELPRLEAVTKPAPALRCSDWLYALDPVMADLAPASKTWWTMVKEQANYYYQQYVQADVLRKSQVFPQLGEELSHYRYVRLESRALSMLQRSIPESCYNAALAGRCLSTVGLLFQVYKSFQPGGLNERQSMLKGLTDLGVADTPRVAVDQLQVWQRWLTKARNTPTIQIPDSSLLLQAIDNLVKNLLTQHYQMAFRCSVQRNELRLDYLPTLDTVETFGQHVLAECENLCLTLGENQGSGKRPRVARLDSEGQEKGKGKEGKKGKEKGPGGKDKDPKESESKGQERWGGDESGASKGACKGWGRSDGCRFGNKCQFSHSEEKAPGSCYNCGSDAHLKRDCPRPGGGRAGSEGYGNPSPSGSGRGGKKGDKGKDKKGGKGGGNEGKGEENRHLNKTTVEEDSPKEPLSSAPTSTSGRPSAGGSEELMTEAVQLLKSLRLSALRVEASDETMLQSGISEDLCWQGSRADVVSWVSGHVRAVSDSTKKRNGLMLVDGGATHGLRLEAYPGEAERYPSVRVSLAVGSTVLSQTPGGTLISAEPVEPLIPVSYLTDLGFALYWTSTGCRLVRGGQSMNVEMVQGCPMIGLGKGLELLEEWENLKRVSRMRKASVVCELACREPQVDVDPYAWLRERVKHYVNKHADLTPVDLGRFLQAVTTAPSELIALAVGYGIDRSGGRSPWNRRARRSHSQGKLLLHLSSGNQTHLKWQGRVLSLDPDKGQDFLKDGTFAYLAALAADGKVAGIVADPLLSSYACRQWHGEKGASPTYIRAREGSDLWGYEGRDRDNAQADNVLLLRLVLLAALAEVGLKETGSAREGLQRCSLFLSILQPEDPAEQASEQPAPTPWLNPGMLWLRKQFGLWTARFDQQTLGHAFRKPTRMLASSIFLVERLDGQKEQGGKTQVWSTSGPRGSKIYHQWPPALGEVIRDAWNQWEQRSLRDVRCDELRRGERPQLAALSAKEKAQWERHYANNHVPYRRDCGVCVEAASRGRPHRRQKHPATQVLAVDVWGPLKPGRDLDNAKPKYVLVGTLTLPGGDGDPESLATPPKVTDEVLEDIGDPGEDEEPLFEELLESCASAPPVPESQIAPPAADSETTALESQVAVDKLVPPVRTLRFARVLKSRSSHEIAFHLAVMISRIRSLGFPVTRLHSDRAREIRAPHVMQVVSALGVYATQTAGESPQSNGRAENAISWLKRRAKTLLFASKLAVEYWPFAVRYAVEQNLREQLLEMGGTTLPPQIPFGSEVQAKLRSWKRPEGLGRKAVWSAETVRAVALGTPPDTVNGQVVSLPDGPLVVAATVFPMPVVPPIKPVYRLTDKTAPDEVVTELRSKPHHSADKPAEDDPEEFRPAEAPVSHRMRGKSSPASVSWIRAFCPGTEWGESDVDFYFDADSLSAVPREEISEGIGRECWDESLVELPGRNEGLRDFEENDGSEEEEHEDGSKDSRLSKLEGEGRGRIESAAKEVLEGGWSVENAREVIAMAAQFLQGYARTGAVGEGEEAGYQSFGLFSHGGVVGVTKHTAMFPSLTKLLTSWVQHHFPDDGFSTVTISSGIRMKRHLDKFNLGGTSNLVTLISGDYDRDGVWIQGAGPDEQSAPVWLDGHQGHVRPIGRQGCKLNPRVYHATAPDACVDGRCLVVGYTKSAIRKATHAQLDELVGVGFPVDRILGRQEKAQLEVEVELPNLEASEVLAESIERLATQAASELHCVKQTLFPIAESLDMSLVKAYDQAAKWAKGLELAERVLRDCVDPPCVRAMSTLNPPGHHTLGSPANTEADVQQEIFLQTKTVALDEVRKQLVDWIPSMTKEYNSITKEKEAVEVTSEERVNQLIEQGIVREVLPGKLVATRKAGAGLRKSRICICGNFQEFDPNEPLNASGVEATTLRALLRVAALNSWTFAAGDVSTAFLNAPITGGTNQDGQEVLIAVRPPSILITAGVCGPKERWLVRRALYGLRAAPRAWAAYRDKQLQQLEIQVDGQETLRLHQSENDPNLWSVCKGSQVRAWVLCYVDDLLVVGPSVVVERVKQGLSGLWKMGTWDSPSDGKAVKYCGMQLFRDPDGTIRIGQQSFVEDLLKRHEVPSDLKAATPLASWEDPLPEENVQLSDVRRAQGIAGEVQWLVSRSRPDLLYAASKLSIWSTRAPTAVWKAAQGVLKYLNATKEMYLVYPPTVPPLGENAHLPFARTPDILEIQVDASHAPQGGRSHQTAIIMHMGCAVAWEAARQTITALSSAESELIAAISGMQLGESMLSLVAELTGLSISPIELTDNAAAVSVLTGEQTAWKGRHLRMRGAALRERVHSNSWRVLHIPGEMNGADIGTKPLGGARLKRLAELIGLRLGGEVEASLSSLNAVADAPKRERTTCISSGTHGAGTTLRKLLLLLVVQTARAEGDTESSSESQSWETLFLIVMCIFVWEAVKLTGRRIHNRVRVRRLGLVAQPREGTRFSGASSLEEGQALSVSAARVTRLGGALSLEESQTLSESAARVTRLSGASSLEEGQALSESAAQVTRSGGASSSEQGQAFSLGDEVQGLNAVVSGLVSEEPPGSPWSTASQVAEAHRRYPQLTRKLESFVWLARSRGWVLQDAGVHEGSAFVIVGLLGAQQARDISRVELLNQHAGELGWTISDVDFDARGCFVLYEYPPVEPSTPTSESSDVGVVEVGSRAGGSDAHDAQGGFQGGAGAVWDHEIQEYDVADAYWTVGPVEGTPGVEGDAQDAQLALDAGQSEVVANPWGEGGNGWASSTVDAPSEEERGHRASPDTLADELLRQGFFRLQEFPGDHFYWLVFPSPGIELPFYAEDPAVGYVIPRLPYERAWMRPLGQPQTEDYWSIDVGRRRITRWHLRRRTLLFDPNHENLALPNITLSDRRLTRLVVRYAEDQSNVRVLQDFRSEGRLSPLGTARWVGSTTFSVL